MHIQELLGHDQGLSLIAHNRPEAPFEGLCTIRSAGKGRILFVKNARFHKELQAASLSLEGLGAVYDQALLAALSDKKDEFIQELRARAQALFSSPSVELSMCRLSRPFYERLHAGQNDEVDGRQMGTAQVHPTASIAQGVFLGAGVTVGANVRIHPGVVVQSGAHLGEGSEIYPNVTIYRFVRIGRGCRIHAGAVIGADGFGYHFHQGKHHKIWHMGGVEIGDDVEIGAGSCVDQGTFAPTTIGAGTRIDNQVQVGHNCQIGKGVILCGQVGVAGSCVLEDYVVAGGAAAIGPDTHLGKGAQVAGLAGVNNDVPAGGAVAGHPARPVREWLKGVAYVRKHSLSREG